MQKYDFSYLGKPSEEGGIRQNASSCLRRERYQKSLVWQYVLKGGLSLLPCLFPLMFFQITFTDPNKVRRDFDQFIVFNKFQSLLQRKKNGWD